MLPEPDRHSSTNERVADLLRRTASLLTHQGAGRFRTGAYRRAADAIEQLPRDVAEILESEGVEGLIRLPTIGQGIAAAIREIVATGRWSLLERLQGQVDPETLFTTVPGIGPGLAERIHRELGVATLEALEIAAHDGRLDEVPGIGPRRAASVRASLEAMLGRRRRERRLTPGSAPSVELLLDVDREYRRRAERGQLQKIAPRRFNPEHEAWLPILHTEREPWHFTVLYSNTARAHDLGRTHDWVVIYAYDDSHVEAQYTVVTETQGALRGRRVVRGREAECRRALDEQRNPSLQPV